MEEKLFKNKYIIVFYDKSDENLVYLFNNRKEICEALNRPITNRNLNTISINLYRSLKRKDHKSNLFKGESLKVYIIDIEED